MKKKYVTPAASTVQFNAESMLAASGPGVEVIGTTEVESTDKIYTRGKWSFGKTSPWEDSAEE